MPLREFYVQNKLFKNTLEVITRIPLLSKYVIIATINNCTTISVQYPIVCDQMLNKKRITAPFLQLRRYANYNRRSKLITQGFERAPNRSMMRAVGFSRDIDFQLPIIAIANAHSNVTPCTIGLSKLVNQVIQTIKYDAKYQEFGTITVR